MKFKTNKNGISFYVHISEVLKHYRFTSDGDVFRIDTNRKLAATKDKDGYVQIRLSVEGAIFPVKVHRVIAWLYVDNPNFYNVVNHKDFNKSNNHKDNLEWVTHKGNALHKVLNGMGGSGVAKKTNKLQEPGIHFDERQGSYRAQIQIFGKKISRRVKTIEQARQVRDELLKMRNSQINKP
jgi:hypothetical protein